MGICYFEGEIIPKTQPFQNLSISIRNNIPELNLDLETSITIRDFHLSVKISSEKQIDDFLTLRNIVRDLLFGIINVYDYIDGCYHDLIIESYKNERDEVTILNTDIMEITERNQRPVTNFQEIFSLFAKPKGNFLRVALHDLTLSIKYPRDTGFFCFRCIESIRNYFDDKNDSNGWALLRTNLNISRLFIDIVKRYADEARHGKLKTLTQDDRINAMRNTWIIVDRFIIYALNEDIPLDKTPYPEL